MVTVILTEREAELIETALESAIRACVGMAGVDNSDTDSLAREYQQALDKVQASS